LFLTSETLGTKQNELDMLTYFKVLKTKMYNSAGWVDFANAEKEIAEKYSLV